MYEILCFWALCLFFLPARSVNSRAALRPEWSVLSQTKFQGWFAGDWELYFLSIDCAQEPILTAPYFAFRLCEIVVPAHPVSTRRLSAPQTGGL